MSWGGSWWASVKSKVTSDQVTRKEGTTHKGIDWPTRKTSGQAAQGRKEGGKRGDETTRAKKSP